MYKNEQNDVYNWHKLFQTIYCQCNKNLKILNIIQIKNINILYY